MPPWENTELFTQVIINPIINYHSLSVTKDMLTGKQIMIMIRQINPLQHILCTRNLPYQHLKFPMCTYKFNLLYVHQKLVIYYQKLVSNNGNKEFYYKETNMIQSLRNILSNTKTI